MLQMALIRIRGYPEGWIPCHTTIYRNTAQRERYNSLSEQPICQITTVQYPLHI
jgi:hypothetical protein